MSRTTSPDTRQDLHEVIESLCDEAVERHGVPRVLALEAAAIAGSRFEREFDRPLRKRDRARVRAYYYGIVRRRAIASRGPELKELRSRFLLSSLAVDLKPTGRSGQEIFLEIARDYAAHVEPSALRALEKMLCG